MKIRNLINPYKYHGYIKFLVFSIRKLHKDAYPTFSQSGEDILIKLAFRFLKITNPSYLDIGAFHPTKLSNTFRLYQDGSRGVCIEPNPGLAYYIKKKRPRDTVLQVAIGIKNGLTTLHIVSDNVFSTTLPDQAKYFKGPSRHSIIKEIEVPVRTVMSIIDEYFQSAPPDLISLDIEGMDLTVLQSFDFKKCRPPVFCIETLAYDETKDIHKIPQIITFMNSCGYFVFADTFLNTIFIDQRRWNAR